VSKKTSSKQKKIFEVNHDETIDQCLDRIKKSGYQPIRRIEKPIFKEAGNEAIPVDRLIQFETIPLKHER
jgi:hypothetical protein